MPLDRAHVTRASRIMLPSYVVLFAVIGANYLLAPIERLQQSPGLAYASTHGSIRIWGAVFAASAALMLAALFLRRRGLYRYALLLCAGTMTVWSSLMGLAAVNGNASPAAFIWPAFVATACLASYRSLTVREV